MRFVRNAGATMNSTTPNTSPNTMDTAISFLPNSASSSKNDFFSDRSAAAGAPASCVVRAPGPAGAPASDAGSAGSDTT